MGQSTFIIAVASVLLPLSSGLTVGEIAKWKKHVAKNMYQGDAVKHKNPETLVPAHSRRSAAVPAYQQQSWWEGEVMVVAEAITAAPPVASLQDPCYFATEECETDALREPAALYTEEPPPGVAIEMLTDDCYWSKESCDVDELSEDPQVRIYERIAAVKSGTRDPQSLSQDPCWWDEECHAFAQ